MTSLDAIRAWQASESLGREFVTEHGLLRQVREGAATSHYTWRAGELTGIVEPNGQRSNYGYATDGRLLTVHENGQLRASYEYNADGRLTRTVRADGSVLSHAYDPQGRVIRTSRGNASPFVYRYAGERVTAARCDREETCFDYDDRGRLVGLNQRVDGISLSVRFTFDARGSLSQLEFPEWRQSIGFDWDERGRPASISWNGDVVSRFGTNDDSRLFWSEGKDGVREETFHEATGGRPVRKLVSRDGAVLWQSELLRDEAFRLIQEGNRSYAYDASGRLTEARDGERHWRYQQDDQDQPVAEDGTSFNLQRDRAGRLRFAGQAGRERVFRHNDAGELLEALSDGNLVARCAYDHKGRLVLKTGPSGTERYLYGADDGLLAIADGQGRPVLLFLRLPIGVVGVVDFRGERGPQAICLHCDVHGNLLFAGDTQLDSPSSCDPFGVPLRLPAKLPYLYRGRIYHADLGLYRLGCRWYDPSLRQFLTPDTHTGAPDDERLLNPFLKAEEQRMARVQLLDAWLRAPRRRNRYSYCENDPVNRFDPDGHWSFGGVLLSLLGVLWTLPNTVFGLAVEVSCLLGEVVRWLVWLFSGGSVSWQTPGFDVASSGQLNAFALVFKGGWLGSFQSLLGITFGNVIFINGEYQQAPIWQNLPDPVKPPAYGGAVTIPKSQALYEHELRHVNQYGWWGPFFHLGLPVFGVYEWDVILHGYQDAGFEQDARDHAGFP